MFTAVARPGAGLFFVAVFLASLLTANRTPITGDARVSLRAAEHWLESGDMALHDTDFRLYNLLPSPNGKRYSKYPLVAFVQSVPAAWFVQHFPEIPAAPGALLLALVPALWTAWFALGLALLITRLGASFRHAMLASALFIVGTPLWIYAHSYYGEVSQAALLTWSLLSVHLARDDARWASCAGALAASAIAAKPLFALFVPCLALTLPQKHWVRFCAGLAPVLACVAAYNWARYHDVFGFGYGGGRDGSLGFSTPLYVGIAGNFLSTGKSVFLYAPCLWLVPGAARAFIRPNRPFWLLAWAAPLAVYVLVICKWWAWSGDLAWGPRLLVPVLAWLALPALVDTARGVRVPRRFIALTALGALVQLPAVVLSEAPYAQHLFVLTRPALQQLATDTTNIADDTLLAHFVPWFSPIVAQWWILCAKLVGYDALPAPPWAGNGFDRLASERMEQPWNLWFDASLSAWFLLFALAGTLALIVVRLRQITYAQPSSVTVGEGQPAASVS